MLKALVAQLLRTNRDLASHVLEKYAFKGVAPSISQLKNLLLQMLAAVESVRIVIDGLDECDEKNHSLILTILLSSSKVNDCKILISSRDGGMIAKTLRNKPTMHINDEHREVEKTIGSFVGQGLQEVRERFDDAAQPLIDDIQEKMVKKAAGKEGSWYRSSLPELASLLIHDTGMILWARLVLVTLQDVHSISELQHAIDGLPEGLIEALVIFYSA